MTTQTESTEIDDGGRAFPVTDLHMPNGQVQVGTNGMSLRDYFAAAALTGMMANPGFNGSTLRDLSAFSYDQADAMLAARKGGAQ